MPSTRKAASAPPRAKRAVTAVVATPSTKRCAAADARMPRAKKQKETPNLVENGEEQAEAMLKDLFANDADKLLVITEHKDNGDVWFKVKMQSSDAQKDAEITSLKAQMAEMMKKMEAAGLGGTSAAAAAAPVAATPKGKDKKPVPVQ